MADHQMPEWLNKVYQELAPAHGRYEGALRTAFAATLATYVLLVLQTPMIAPGIYLIYLVSYDMPYQSSRAPVDVPVLWLTSRAVIQKVRNPNGVEQVDIWQRDL